jgi:hypothetical protein
MKTGNDRSARPGKGKSLWPIKSASCLGITHPETSEADQCTDVLL